MPFDAIVIGAGMSGMYQVHMLRKAGLSCLLLEAGSDVGGTWYWNRYPGCRFDSETVSYCFSFDEEVLQAWNWTEKFAPQPETLRYLNYVADKLDLRRDMRFNARVTAAHYDVAGNTWKVTTEDGRTETSRFLITAVGILSAPVIPPIPGREAFAGRSFHTSDWPRNGLDLSGKRVAVFGTGATGVQLIQEAGKVAAQLTVFQKEASWAKPLKNEKISPQEMEALKAQYASVFARCKSTAAGFIHDWDPRSLFDVSDAERERIFEERYDQPGFAMWLGNFQDLATSVEAADIVSDFIARKIRQRVKDPAVAERLIPKDHPFGARRVPMETGYYETYNQPNVRLIDVNETPVERITPRGVQVGGEELEFDVIVFATGFDAVRGAFDRIDIRGVDGLSLKEKWVDGPITYMGLQVHGFPNMFMLVGPHNGATFCNVPRCIEQNV
ncbi:MAG TPA: NAD(P)/FAD-dependent oxidoreductase, partial [Phenylobacterium sp.]